MKLTVAQERVLTTGRLPLQDRTLEILSEQGFIQRGWPMRILDRGVDFIVHKMEADRLKMERSFPDLPFIDNDRDLFNLLQENPEGVIYSFKGKFPAVMASSMTWSPMALLDPIYKWQIDAIKSRGKFLERVLSADGRQTKAYRMKNEYQRRMVVPIDGVTVELVY